MLAMVMILGFFYDMEPMLTEIREQASQVSLLQAEAQRAVDSLNKIDHYLAENTPRTKYVLTQFYADLVMAAELDGLTMVAMRVDQAPTQTNRFIKAHIRFNADFQGLFRWVWGMSHTHYPVTVSDFSCHTTVENKLDCLMLFLSPVSFNQRFILLNKTFPGEVSNPFCGGSLLQHVQGANMFSVKFMKIVGYWRQADEKHLFMLLPNHRIQIVNKGDVIGLERAKVTDIGEREITLLFPDSHTLTIK
jgi:hypothetical protein